MQRFLPVALVALLGCSDSTSPSGGGCLAPAPVYNTRQPNLPGVIVAVTPDSNVALLVATWAGRYRFEPRQVWTVGFTGFAADLDDKTVSALRCEAGVSFIEYDTTYTLDAWSH